MSLVPGTVATSCGRGSELWLWPSGHISSLSSELSSCLGVALQDSELLKGSNRGNFVFERSAFSNA